MTLYEIDQALSESMTKLGEMLENGETPSQVMIDELLDLKNDLQNKLVNYGKFIKNTQSDIDGLDGEIKRLTAIKKAKASHIELLKSRMLTVMIDNGIDKINDPIMPIRLQNSPASVHICTNPESLPGEFVKIKYDADKTALVKALKSGMVIDGVELVQSKHIRIG